MRQVRFSAELNGSRSEEIQREFIAWLVDLTDASWEEIKS